MRDDEADDGERGRHDVATVPPPPGESDIYDAKTQVGGLPPEAMALLRQLREGPEAGRSIEEANVPVFVEDSGAKSDPAPGSLRGRAAPAVRPAAGAPVVRPAPAPEPSLPDYSVTGPAAGSPLRAARLPEEFSAPQSPPSGPSSDPRAYESVFAPLAAAARVQEPPPPPLRPAPAPKGGVIIVVGVLVLVALVVVVLAQAGVIPGLAPLGAPPASSAAPAR